jgi:hypothetical protein
MAENDLQKEIKKVTRKAKQEKKREQVQEKTKEKTSQKESMSYTAIIVATLEYEGANAPAKEQLAEELGRTIIKWVDQKGFYGISSRESVPKLISIDVDIK